MLVLRLFAGLLRPRLSSSKLSKALSSGKVSVSATLQYCTLLKKMLNFECKSADLVRKINDICLQFYLLFIACFHPIPPPHPFLLIPCRISWGCIETIRTIGKPLLAWFHPACRLIGMICPSTRHCQDIILLYTIVTNISP